MLCVCDSEFFALEAGIVFRLDVPQLFSSFFVSLVAPVHGNWEPANRFIGMALQGHGILSFDVSKVPSLSFK